MNRIVRSKIANDAKKKYIKEGKKSAMIKKLSDKVKENKLNRMTSVGYPTDEESNSSLESNSNTDASIDTDSGSDSSYDIPLKSKPKKSNLEYLTIQKEIEELRLQQIKQAKKASKVQREVIEAKSKTRNTDALKKQLLIDF